MLISDRLNLRLITIDDLINIHQLHSFPEVDKFNTLGIPEDLETTRQVITPWIAQHQAEPIQIYTFAIEQKRDNTFVGLFGLKLSQPKFRKAEVWYKIHPDFWKKGFATEALKCVLNFSFQSLKLHRITAGCAVENLGSIKVLEKVGMIREGRGRQVLPLASGWSDNYEYAILEDDLKI